MQWTSQIGDKQCKRVDFFLFMHQKKGTRSLTSQIVSEWTFQKLRRSIYILGLAKNSLYPKWLNGSERTGGFCVEEMNTTDIAVTRRLSWLKNFRNPVKTWVTRLPFSDLILNESHTHTTNLQWIDLHTWYTHTHLLNGAVITELVKPLHSLLLLVQKWC